VGASAAGLAGDPLAIGFPARLLRADERFRTLPEGHPSGRFKLRLLVPRSILFPPLFQNGNLAGFHPDPGDPGGLPRIG